MASPSQILKLLVQADVDGAVAGLKKVGAAADKDLGKAETKAQETSAKLTKMGAASLAAGAVMATALYSTIEPASALNEAINLTGLTFGESADEMEKWADGAAKSVGLAADEALKSAAAIGGLLKNVGFLEDESADLSRQLVALAADMGSAFDMSTTEALEALRSGLAGESEPLKRFNVFLNETAVKAKAMEMGISDGTSALSEHEKAQARLAIIMEQTADIQGDFANTADSAANASKTMAAEMRNLKANVGEAVLPIFQDVVGVVNGLAGAFNSLPDPVQGVISKMLVLGAGLTLLSGGFLTALGRVRDLRAEWGRLASASPRLATGIGVAGVAIATAAFALDQYNNAAKEQAAKADAVERAWAGAATEADRFVDAIAGMSEQDGAMNAVAVLDELGLTSGHVQRAFREADGDARVFYDTLGEMAGISNTNALVMTGMFDALTDGIDAFEAAGRVADTSAGQVGGMAGSVDSLYRSAENAAGSVSSFGDNVSIMTEPLRTFEEIADDAADALDRIFGTILDGKKIQADFEQALDDATDAVQEHGAEFDLSTEAGRDYLANQEDVVDAMHDTAQAMVDQQRPADEIRRRLQGMVTDYTNTLVAAGLSRSEAELLAAALLEIPEQVETELKNNGYDQMMSELAMIMSYLDQIEGQHNAQVFVTPSYSSPSGGGSGPAEDTSSGGGGGSSTGPGGASFGARSPKRDAPTEITINNRIEVDGREIAKVIERESDRGGGLKVKIRGGQ